MAYRKLTVLVLLSLALAALAFAAPAQAQEPPPALDYEAILTWRSAAPARAADLAEDAPAASCASCRSAAAPGEPPADQRPPEKLLALLNDLQARQEVRILAWLPAGVRLQATLDAFLALEDYPLTADLKLIAKPAGPAPEPAEAAAGPLAAADVIDYTYVTNQGAAPPITYDWIDISATGAKVAVGDDTSQLVSLGFSFTFYGTAYTSAYVSSNGFVSFGAGSSSYSNTAIPNVAAPNNAIYAFWDDLIPNGGANGNVYVKKIDASRYVIQWQQVKRIGSSGKETFEIILNGADNTITLQYNSVVDPDSCTAGVESQNGARAAQYAYNAAGQIFDGLAVKFTPQTVATYTIGGHTRRDDGAAIAGARVAIVAGPAAGYADSDAAGAYSLTVTPGEYILQATKAGYVAPPTQTVTVPPSRADVDFTFPATYTITGAVRDFNGVPVQGAMVQIIAGPSGATVFTNASGAYVLTVGAGAFTIRVTKDGYVTPPDQVVTTPPSRADVNFAFGEPLVIAGVVREYDGSPLADQRVCAHPGAFCDNTDAAGHYELHPTAAGVYCVSVNTFSRPQPPAQAVVVPPNRRDVDFTMDRVYTLAGVVRDADGQGAPNVSVSIAIGPISAWASTGADGSYSLALISGTYKIQFQKSGHFNPPPVIVTVPPAVANADTAFDRLYAVSGTVTGAGNAPLSYAYVSACPTGGGRCVGASTNASGAYSLYLPAGSWEVDAQKSGYPTSPERTVVVPPAQSGVDFHLAPSASYTIAGRVQTAAGAPLAGVIVTLSQGNCWGERSVTTGANGLFTFNVDAPGNYLLEAGPTRAVVAVPPTATNIVLIHPGMYEVAGVVRGPDGAAVPNAFVETWIGDQAVSATTDDAGHYSLRLPPGTYALAFRRDGFAAGPPLSVTVPPDKTNADYAFPSPARIIGVVRDQSGRPVRDATVTAAGADGTLATANTSECGVYELIVAAGSYSVSVSSYHYTSPAPVVGVVVPPDRVWLDFVLLNRSVIRGVARLEGGAPVPNAYIVAEGASWQSDFSATDGAYWLSVPAGAYLVRASKADLVSPTPLNVAVPPDKLDAHLVFPAGHLIRGRVNRVAGGGIAGAQVIAYDAGCGTLIRETLTDATGAYSLTVPTGSYDVRAVKDGYSATIIGHVSVPPAVSLFNFAIALPNLFTIAGAVRDTAGAPIADASILPAGCTLPAASQETDAGGAYALSLSAGAYRVTVSGDDLATATHAINVAGPRSDLDFTLTPNCCDIFGYVRDAAGRPINDAYVRVMSGPDWDSVWTSDCGRFGLQLNAPGSYTVRAYADGYVPVSRTLTVSSSRPDLDFTLTRLPGGDATVLCTVRDQAGQPVMGARIWVGPAGMNYSSSDSRRTNAAGQLSLVLPPGVYDLYADRDCYADAAPVRVTTPPGASINLTLHVGTNRIAGRITDQSGASVFGAGLYAWDAAGRRGSDYATSDSNGNYLLRVAPGSWSVRVYPPSTCNYAYPLPLVLTVPPDRTNANFVLQAGAATPTPTATPPAGQPEVWMPLILKRR